MMTVSTLVGHGLYDVGEVARLVGVGADTVKAWTTPTSKRPALLEPQLDPFFSFHDLLTLKMVGELARRGVKLSAIATGLGYLERETGVARPFAHRDMGTSGRAWFSDIGGHKIDVGRGGQMAWDAGVDPTLRTLAYASDDMAHLWRPRARVWLNPAVQAGASCIDGTRTGTRFIWDLTAAGTDLHDIAWEFELDVDDVIAALDFERQLNEHKPFDLLGS